MSTKRETIFMSLGSTANSVSAHLWNLYGLAATVDDEGATTCTSSTTHSVYQQTLVPRMFMVDEPQQFQHLRSNRSSTRSSTSTSASQVLTWHGPVEIQQRTETPTTTTTTTTTDQATNTNSTHSTNADETLLRFERLQEAATYLAYSEHSRYRAKDTPRQQQQQNVLHSESQERHVNWDDMEDEEDMDNDDDFDDNKQRQQMLQQQQQHQWIQTNKVPLESQMDTLWEKQQKDTELPWMHYLMPPYAPTFAVPIPFTKDSYVDETWDTYQKGATSENVESIMMERLRHLLEDCDSIQGAVLMTEGYGIYSGLAMSLLQELEQECKAAGRMVVHVVDPPEPDIDEGWQPSHVRMVRRYIQKGLALNGLATHSHTIVPLSIDTNKSFFHATTQLALALETATLPYRVDGQGSQIGLAGGYYGGAGFASAGYGTVEHLSFGEYLASLQPSSRFKVLELDINNTTTDLANTMMEGTSMERDVRMRIRGAQLSRPQDILPGGWLEADDLVSCSPKSVGNRSLHSHFASSGLWRPAASPPITTTTMSDYLTCTMEGIGIRYRPEVSMSIVAKTGIHHLISGGYGAGSYWHSIVSPQTPVLAVLSNSTRSYSYLHSVSSNMTQGLSRKFHGYHVRDAMQNVLPEAEDCKEAMEYCLDLRDIYHPPNGSGLGVDEEGTYFDEGNYR